MKHVLTVNKILFVFCLFCVNVFAAEFGLIEKDDDFNKIHVKDEGSIKYIYAINPKTSQVLLFKDSEKGFLITIEPQPVLITEQASLAYQCNRSIIA